MRRATTDGQYYAITAEFLPTPSVRRATDGIKNNDSIFLISTHALREEGDINTLSGKVELLLFLPTPSVRRATMSGIQYLVEYAISTHALREEGDNLPASGRGVHENFYPRPP